MEIALWNTVLSGVIGIMVFLMKAKFDEVNRLTILVNKTREELAKDYMPRTEITAAVNKLGDRFDLSFQRLEDKLDQIKEARHGT